MLNEEIPLLKNPEREKLKGYYTIKDDGLTLTWRDLSIYARTRPDKNEPHKRLIDNVFGIVKPGNLVALMGPSGAGKSTLLEALAHRSSGDVLVKGDIRANGRKLSKDFRRGAGFLHQEDLFIEKLTVREHLEFTARLKIDQIRCENSINQIIDNCLRELNLLGCVETTIGRPGEKNCISGGERKRLALAAEILTNPVALFCDEPTTGLDSFSALNLITLLKEMSSKGKTVLCSVHQPSSELFAIFHRVILLSEGRIAFTGSKEEALKFFQENGYSCSQNLNPAEVIIEALSLRSHDDDKYRKKKLCDKFLTSEKALKIEKEILLACGANFQYSAIRDFQISSGKRFSSLKKFYWLTKRSFLQVLRDPSIQVTRIIQKLAIALMAALCFQGNVTLTQKGIQNTQGAIFVLITENSFPPMYGVLSLFADEYPLLLRERKSNLYSVGCYYAAKLVSLWPGLVLEPILFLLAGYFIMGLKATSYAFFMTCWVAIMAAQVASACGSFFVNTFGSISVVMAVLVPLDYMLMVTSGLFVKLSSLPFYISWIRYFSWFMYANEAISLVQWENVSNITCEYADTRIPCLKTGEDVLKKFSFTSGSFSENITAMGVLYLLFHILACLMLVRRTRKHL